jgi:hypothetical protein
VERKGVRGTKLFFSIDRLIAADAVCPGPPAKSITFVAKVSLDRLPIPFPRCEQEKPENAGRREEEDGVCGLWALRGYPKPPGLLG